MSKAGHLQNVPIFSDLSSSDLKKISDKMVNSGQLKKNTAARRKSRLTRHLNSLNK